MWVWAFPLQPAQTACFYPREQAQRHTFLFMYMYMFCLELYWRRPGSSNKRTSYAPNVPGWVSQVQPERMWILNSLYFSVSHLHVPLLSQQFGSLKLRANCCGAGRQAYKKTSWVFNIGAYFWWDSCDHNLSQVWAMFIWQQIQASAWPWLSFQSHGQCKGWQVEQKPTGLLSATSLKYSHSETLNSETQENLFKLSDHP